MENIRTERIGVLDSGLGGLTVVRELELMLPSESILYFGDNANCPYGNRPREKILDLSLGMLDLMQKQGVKIAAIACNTISTLIDEFRKRYEFPIVSIIEEACKYVVKNKLRSIGVFATSFTISQGLYSTLIQGLSPDTEVYGIPSRTLASLIDEGRFYDKAAMDEIEEEVYSLINNLLLANPETKHVVLGCTHYPIVRDLFEKAAPGLAFINPAVLQAETVKAILSGRDLLNDSKKTNIDIFTSGEREQYDAAMEKLKIRGPVTLTKINKGEFYVERKLNETH